MENYKNYDIKSLPYQECIHIRVANEEADDIFLEKLRISRGIFENLGMKKAKFKNCNITQSIIRDCYLREAEFINVNFTGTKFIGCNLERAIFKSCNFRYVTFDRCKLNISEILGSLPFESNLLKGVLRELRRNEESMGEYKSADMILLKELATERQLYLDRARAKTSYFKEKTNMFERVNASWNFICSFFEDLLWGYGLKISRLLLSGIVLIILFAFLFYTTKEVYKLGNDMVVLDLEQSIYLSALSFSTLGYGEYIPQTNVGKLLICFENLFGGIFIGFFAAAVYRRIAR